MKILTELSPRSLDDVYKDNTTISIFAGTDETTARKYEFKQLFPSYREDTIYVFPGSCRSVATSTEHAGPWNRCQIRLTFLAVNVGYNAEMTIDKDAV